MSKDYINIVGVTFKKYGKKYYFDSSNINVKKNITVIVDTEYGLQFGTVITNIIKVKKDKISFPLKKIIRISTKKDYTNHLNNIRDAKIAFNKCNELIKKLGLNMKLINSNYTFERSQLFFSFMSTERVDFRELAKELAKIYKVRIELRQIGPRDKAKEIGGLGPCGRPLCCSTFLYSFDNITINMAKNQNISLNPNKINGTCNRLYCLLSYEDDNYKEIKKDMPKVGQTIEYNNIKGKVISVNIFNKSYKIETKEKGIIEVK